MMNVYEFDACWGVLSISSLKKKTYVRISLTVAQPIRFQNWNCPFHKIGMLSGNIDMSYIPYWKMGDPVSVKYAGL